MRIGITTFYYHTYNYGANLQAFALCKVVNDLGYNAEQICFNPTSGFKRHKMPLSKRIEYAVKTTIFTAIDFLHNPLRDISYFYRYKRRCKAVEKFCRDYVPHSKNIYTAKNIVKSQQIYDVYITGSDVVWSPKTSSDILFLRFLSSDKAKLAYAPSLGTDILTEEERLKIAEDLDGFMAVSSRESSGVKLLSELTQFQVFHCLDSTLLLSIKTWNSMVDKRIIPEKYVFCYFIGNNVRARHLSIEFARQRGLKVVNIAYYWDKYRAIDDYGDYKLYDISPVDFLSLIKYADYVMTDSFHACVFSQIFQKQFYAFHRDRQDKLSVRISDFLQNTNAFENYLDSESKETMQYINTIADIDYSVSGLQCVQDKIDASIKYLKDNLANIVSNLN